MTQLIFDSVVTAQIFNHNYVITNEWMQNTVIPEIGVIWNGVVFCLVASRTAERRGKGRGGMFFPPLSEPHDLDQQLHTSPYHLFITSWFSNAWLRWTMTSWWCTAASFRSKTALVQRAASTSTFTPERSRSVKCAQKTDDLFNWYWHLKSTFIHSSLTTDACTYTPSLTSSLLLSALYAHADYITPASTCTILFHYWFLIRTLRTHWKSLLCLFVPLFRLFIQSFLLCLISIR